MRHLSFNRSFLPLVLVITAACTTDKNSEGSADSAAAVSTPATAPAAAGDTPASADRAPSTAMRLEVDLQSRSLLVSGETKGPASYPVAVGSTQWPTQTGEWTIRQVVINPEWNPPDESWAEQKEPREPGDPKNPLGRVQLVYDPPRSIHGTNEPASIGKAVSHGSIRMGTADITALAIRVLKAGGATEDAAWVNKALANPKEKQIVDLPNPIPIRVF